MKNKTKYIIISIAIIVPLLLIALHVFVSSNIHNIYNTEKDTIELKKTIKDNQTIIDSLQLIVDSLLSERENNPKEIIIEKILIRYEKERNNAADAINDSVFLQLSRNLSESNSK